MAKKPAKRRASYEAQADEPLPITPLEYSGLQQAFAFLNAKLFEGALPDVVLTYQRKAKSGGFFGAERFTRRGIGEREHEIALNPDFISTKDDRFVVSILLHEMTHEWQHVCGKPPKRSGYHDRQWAAKMELVGLMPSSTGAVGGRVTGARMQHYIIEGGPFSRAFAELAASGWRLHLESTPYRGESRAPKSKTKFTCPGCGWNVWGKPDTEVFCKPCSLTSGGKPIELRAENVATVPTVQSYEQQVA